MPGPFTCSALTVIDPAFPPDELVCSLTVRLMPPGNGMARFGFEATMGWPAATSPTSWEFPVAEAVAPLQAALEFDLTTSAATSPPNRFTSVMDDCDWLLVPLPDVVLLSASAEARPRRLTLAKDVFRFPPPAGSAPVSASATLIPNALA